MGCCHGVVRFLEDEKYFGGVDRLFLGLVKMFHQIPQCATLGVSCAGHFEETDGTDEWHKNSFDPSPWGHLNIAVASDEPHIRELLDLLQMVIAQDSDATFKKFDHLFGPPKGSKVEVWEIRIGDNGAVPEFGTNYCGGYLEKKGNRKVYLASKKRYVEIEEFWKRLEVAVDQYCNKNGFNNLDLHKRAEELFARW